ncbi:MAG: tetratricopeptide repeat protein [Candidatus Methylomirabilales bacterium]
MKGRNMRCCVLLHIAALTIATMVGCTQPLDFKINFDSDRGVTPQQIDQLVAEEEYGKALDIFNYVPITHPQYALFQKKLTDVKKRAAAYEKAVLKNMRAKMAKGNWSGALDEVDAGLKKLPSSLVLKRGREELLTKRARRIAELETELLIAKGQWLAQDAPLRERLADVESQNLFDKWKHSSKKSEVEETAKELYACSERGINENNFEQAKKCLDLAERLDSSDTIQAAVRELRQQIVKREAETQRIQQHAQKEKFAKQAQEAMDKGQLGKARKMVSQLAKIAPDDPDVRKLQRRLKSLKKQAHKKHKKKVLQDYERLAKQAKEAMAQGDVRKAQQIVPKLAKIDPDNPDVHLLQQRLKETVAIKVNKMLKRGSRLYRDEKIKEAKQVWEEVLELDPSNKQAQEGVERAERVLKKLRVLEEKERPPQEAFP